MLTGFGAVEEKDIPPSMPWRARVSRCRMRAVRENSPRTFTIGYRLDETRKRAAGKPDREHIAATRQGRREATGKELPMSERALHGIWADWSTTVRFRVPGEDAGEAEEALERLLESPDAVRAVQLEYAANALEDCSLSGAVDLVCSGDVESPGEGTEIGALGGDLSPKALAERARKAERALSEKVTEMRFGNIVARRWGSDDRSGKDYGGLEIGFYGEDGAFQAVALVEEYEGEARTVAWEDDADGDPAAKTAWKGPKPKHAGI